MSKQLTLTLSSPPKHPRIPLTPTQKLIKSERNRAHRIFKLHKSNKFNHFSTEDRQLLKKYYGIKTIEPLK